MRNIAIQLVFALTLALGIGAAPAHLAAASAGEKTPKAKKPNMQRVAEHLRVVRPEELAVAAPGVAVREVEPLLPARLEGHRERHPVVGRGEDRG